MWLPIRLNKYKFSNHWKIIFGNYLKDDPRILTQSSSFNGVINGKVFSKVVSELKFGTTFKTTSHYRHQLSDEIMLKICLSHFLILDIGASDGVTSYNTITKLNNNFKTYFITDYNLYLSWANHKNTYYFFDPKSSCCVLVVNDFFIFYPQESPIIAIFFKKNFFRLREQSKHNKEILLINPDVQKKITGKILIRSFDAFSEWNGEKMNIIKVANVLNLSYFSGVKIVEALKNIHSILLDGGYLLIIENRSVEQGGLYRKKANKFEFIELFGNGSDINHLIISSIF